MTERLLDLPVKIFADGADLQGIAELSRQPYIHGLTTNPTLMRKVGLTDYESFAKAVLKEVKSKPISFEVFSDDFAEMLRQALKMHEWQDNVYAQSITTLPTRMMLPRPKPKPPPGLWKARIASQVLISEMIKAA